MKTPGVEQGGLPVAAVVVEVGDASDHQPARDVLGGLAGAERGERDLGDLGARDPPLGSLVVDGVGVLDGRPRLVTDRGDGGTAVEREVCPSSGVPVASLLRRRVTMARVSPMIRAAPRGEPQEPLRRRWPVITGAPWPVVTVAIVERLSG